MAQIEYVVILLVACSLRVVNVRNNRPHDSFIEFTFPGEGNINSWLICVSSSLPSNRYLRLRSVRILGMKYYLRFTHLNSMALLHSAKLPSCSQRYRLSYSTHPASFEWSPSKNPDLFVGRTASTSNAPVLVFVSERHYHVSRAENEARKKYDGPSLRSSLYQHLLSRCPHLTAFREHIASW